MKTREMIGVLMVGLALFSTGPALGAIYYQIDESGVAHFTNAPTTPEYRPLPETVSRPSPVGATNIEQSIQVFAAEHDLDAALIKAVIQAESNFNPRAVSRKGAQGLMQLMPSTIWRLSVADAFDPHENIGAGVRYLRQLLDQFQGDLTLALAAYNAGENAVLRYKGVPPYRETQDYVRKVQAHYQRTLGERPGSAMAKVASRRAVQLPPAPPPPTIYKAEEASGAILYSNIPPIVRSPGF